MGFVVVGGIWLLGVVGGKVGFVGIVGIFVWSVVRYIVGCVIFDGRFLLGVISVILVFGLVVGIGGDIVGLVVGRGWLLFDVDCGL